MRSYKIVAVLTVFSLSLALNVEARDARDLDIRRVIRQIPAPVPQPQLPAFPALAEGPGDAGN